MERKQLRSPYTPLSVPVLLALGFAYVSWSGYSSESENPIHQLLAFFFEAKLTTIGAALAVSFWAVYAVVLGRQAQQNPSGPSSAAVPETAAPETDDLEKRLAALARDLALRLELSEPAFCFEELPAVAEALRSRPLEEAHLPQVAGELGAFLGETLRREHGAHWVIRTEDELGPFAYQASAILLPAGEEELQINVFSVALRSLHHADELLSFRNEVLQALAG